jgi:hypothetical protein
MNDRVAGSSTPVRPRGPDARRIRLPTLRPTRLARTRPRPRPRRSARAESAPERPQRRPRAARRTPDARLRDDSGAGLSHRRRVAAEPRVGLPDAPATGGRGTGRDGHRRRRRSETFPTHRGREGRGGTGGPVAAVGPEFAPETINRRHEIRDAGFQAVHALRQVMMTGTDEQRERAARVPDETRRKRYASSPRRSERRRPPGLATGHEVGTGEAGLFRSRWSPRPTVSTGDAPTRHARWHRTGRRDPSRRVTVPRGSCPRRRAPRRTPHHRPTPHQSRSIRCLTNC